MSQLDDMNDWKADVQAGETLLGFADWLKSKAEKDSPTLSSVPHGSFLDELGGARYVTTGEYRAPRAGEFFLQGWDRWGCANVTIKAHQAAGDLIQEYWIAKPVAPGVPQDFINLLFAVTRGSLDANPFADSDVRDAMYCLAYLRGCSAAVGWLGALDGLTYTGDKPKPDIDEAAAAKIQSSKTITLATAGNLEELFECLSEMSPGESQRHEIVIYNQKGKPVTLRLIEDTLTDGSKATNINIE